MDGRGMYSSNPDHQPCTGGGGATTEMCGRCLFTERCLEDTLEIETLLGEPRRGIFGGLTEVQRIHLHT